MLASRKKGGGKNDARKNKGLGTERAKIEKSRALQLDPKADKVKRRKAKEKESTLGQVTFGQLLRRRRNESGLTQKALAEKVMLSPGYLNRIEKGERSAPDRKKVLALATVLELSTGAGDELLLAAGYAPTSYRTVKVDLTDPMLSLVARSLETFDPSVRPEMWERVVDFVNYLKYMEENQK